MRLNYNIKFMSSSQYKLKPFFDATIQIFTYFSFITMQTRYFIFSNLVSINCIHKFQTIIKRVCIKYKQVCICETLAYIHQINQSSFIQTSVIFHYKLLWPRKSKFTDIYQQETLNRNSQQWGVSAGTDHFYFVLKSNN